VVQLVPPETVDDAAAPETSQSEPPPAPTEVEPEPRPEPTEVGSVQDAIDAPASAPVPHVLDHPRGGAPDDLTALTGVGEKLAKALNAAGIYHFDQIAALDEEAIAWLETRQKGFRMTCARHDLVGQAKARA
jgi:NADH-quinone oxidoreductase subunit E